MEGFVAPVEAVLDERAQHAVLLVVAVKEGANVTMPAECGSGDLHHAQFTPAAAMSGVVPARVARFGSAPRCTSSRIVVVSPESAARSNGVCPVKSTHDTSLSA